MTLDQIDRMLRQANPVPDPTVLEPVDVSDLEVYEPGRTAMPTRGEPGIERRRAATIPVRGLLIGIGVAVATVIAIGAVVLVQGDEAPVADDPSVEAAVAMAERFMEARDTHDLEEVVGMLAYDEVPDQYRLRFNLEQILGYRFDAIECVEDSEASSNDFIVVCTYQVDSRLHEIAGLPPVESSARLRVMEAGIHPVIHGGFLTLDWFPDGDAPDEVAGFMEWLWAEHPSNSLFISPGPGQTLNLILTPDNLRLLEAYVDEYERSVND